MGDEYYHLSPAPFPLPSLPNTPDILDHAPESTRTAIFSSLSVPWLPPHRSKTPDSSALGGNGGRGQGHRRSTSVGVFSSSSSVSVTPVPLGTVRTRRRGSVQGLLAAVGDAFPSNNSLGQSYVDTVQPRDITYLSLCSDRYLLVSLSLYLSLSLSLSSLISFSVHSPGRQ